MGRDTNASSAVALSSLRFSTKAQIHNTENFSNLIADMCKLQEGLVSFRGEKMKAQLRYMPLTFHT